MDNRRRQLRYNLTTTSNAVRRWIVHMIEATDKPEWRDPLGFPSFWPFFNDVLIRDVRACVEAARELEAYERPERLV